MTTNNVDRNDFIFKQKNAWKLSILPRFPSTFFWLNKVGLRFYFQLSVLVGLSRALEGFLIEVGEYNLRRRKLDYFSPEMKCEKKKTKITPWKGRKVVSRSVSVINFVWLDPYRVKLGFKSQVKSVPEHTQEPIIPERATSILRLWNGVFTSRCIFG